MPYQVLIYRWVKIHSQLVGHQLFLIDLVPDHLDLVETKLVIGDLIPGPSRDLLQINQGHLNEELVVNDCSTVLQTK